MSAKAQAPRRLGLVRRTLDALALGLLAAELRFLETRPPGQSPARALMTFILLLLGGAAVSATAALIAVSWIYP